MTLVFTICSINYLAQAKTLGESLMQHHPDVQFVIGLVDILDQAEINTEQLPAFPMLEVAQLHIPNFDWMCANYDITELNTAVKPYYISRFFEESSTERVIYFDPDIIIYQPLDELLTKLFDFDIIVTPHITTPPPADDLTPTEHIHLNTGIYNLGFIALSRSENTFQFVKWWEQKLAYSCRIDLCEGLFVDQNWVNFAPYYFSKVLIERDLGCNVAYWNLHERVLTYHQEKWWVNGSSVLYFFHFSGYQLHRPRVLSKYQNRYDFEQRADVWPLFEHYGQRLTANGNEYYSQFACAYIKPPVVYRYQRVRKLLKLPLLQLQRILES
jgi:hypothetical protein